MNTFLAILFVVSVFALGCYLQYLDEKKAKEEKENKK